MWGSIGSLRRWSSRCRFNVHKAHSATLLSLLYHGFVSLKVIGWHKICWVIMVVKGWTGRTSIYNNFSMNNVYALRRWQEKRTVSLFISLLTSYSLPFCLSPQAAAADTGYHLLGFTATKCSRRQVAGTWRSTLWYLPSTDSFLIHFQPSILIGEIIHEYIWN